MTSLVPRDQRLLPTWLARVNHGLEACGVSYAQWIARQQDLVGPPDEHVMHMAAWAWFSGRPGLAGHRLLRRGWAPEMSFKRGREELAAWRQRLRLIECLGPGIERPWLADGTASGYTFVALRTVEDFIAESEALENCLDQYADQLRTGRKTATIRLGDKSSKYRKGMLVTVLVGARYGQREKVFDAVIDKVEVKQLSELSPREIEHDNPEIRRVDEFTEWLGRLYNRPVSDEDTVTVIRFSQIVGTMF